MRIRRQKKWIAPIMAVLLALLLAVSGTCTAFADDDTETTVDTAELESEKAELEDYLGDLNDNLNDTAAQLDDIQSQIADVQGEISTLEQELAEAEAKAQSQYDAMKLRIKYMYESGNVDTVSVILSSDSFGELLNSYSFISEMVKYDREQLEAYQETQNTIASSQQALQNQQSELEGLESQANEQYSTVMGTISDVSTQISDYDAALEEAYARMKAEEEAEVVTVSGTSDTRTEEEKQGDSSDSGDSDSSSGGYTGSYVSSDYDNDLALLAMIMYREAGNQPYEGIIAVGTVVMNRVDSPRFPNTVYEVLYQPGQFEPAAQYQHLYTETLAYYRTMVAAGQTDTFLEAAKLVLSGYRSGPWLFFWVNDGVTVGTVIGAHIFSGNVNA